MASEQYTSGQKKTAWNKNLAKLSRATAEHAQAAKELDQAMENQRKAKEESLHLHRDKEMKLDDLERAKKILKMFENNLSAATQSQTAAAQRVEELKIEDAALKQRLSDLEFKMKMHQSELNAKNLELQDLMHKLTQTTLLNNGENLAYLQAKIRDSEAALEKLQAQLVKVEATVQSLQAQAEQLSDQLDALLTSLEVIRERIEQLHESQRVLQQDQAESRELMAKQRSQIQKLKKSILALKQKKAGLKDYSIGWLGFRRKRNLNPQRELLDNRIAHLTDKLHDLQAEFAETCRHAKELQVESKDLDAQVRNAQLEQKRDGSREGQITRKLNAASRTLGESQSELGTLEYRIKVEEGELQQTRNKERTAQLNAAQLESERAQAEQKIHQLEEQVRHGDDELNLCRGRSELHSRELTEATKDLSALNAQIKDQAGMVQKCNNDIQMKEKSLAFLDGQIQVCRKRLAETSVTAKSSESSLSIAKMRHRDYAAACKNFTLIPDAVSSQGDYQRLQETEFLHESQFENISYDDTPVQHPDTHPDPYGPTPDQYLDTNPDPYGVTPEHYPDTDLDPDLNH